MRLHPLRRLHRRCHEPEIPVTLFAVSGCFPIAPASCSPSSSSSSSPPPSCGAIHPLAASFSAPKPQSGLSLFSFSSPVLAQSVLPFLDFVQTMDLRLVHRAVKEVCEQRAIQWMNSHFPLARQTMARDFEDARGTMVREEHRGVKKAERLSTPSSPSSHSFLLSDAIWAASEAFIPPSTERLPRPP